MANIDPLRRQRTEVRTEAQRERDRLDAQAREARDRLDREAKEAQDRIRKQQSDVEREAEAAKARAREAERLEQRKRDLPFTKPSPLGTVAIIAGIEERRKKAHTEGGKVRTEIEAGKKKAIADVEKQKIESEAEIERWEKESLVKIKQAERDYKRAVAKSEKEARAVQVKQLATFEADNVKLDYKDEYVSKADYASIPDQKGKNYIKRYGVDAYNKWAEKEARAYVLAPLPTVPLAKGIWRGITTYLKERFISPDIPSQKELKAQYDKEISAPLWSRLLFGFSVVRDPKTKECYSLVMGEPPLVSGAPRVPAKLAQTLAKTIEINWNKLVSPKVGKPVIDWTKLTKAIEAGKVRNADEAARWVDAQAKWFPKTTLTPGTPKYQAWMKSLTKQGLKDAAQAATRARAIGVGKIISVPSTTKIIKTINNWTKINPTVATKQMIASGFVTVAIATSPLSMNRALSRLSPAQRTRVLAVVLPSIAVAIQTGQLAKAQALASTQVQVQTQVQVLVQQATELALRLQTLGLTAAEVQAKVQAQVQTQVKAITKTAVKTQIGPLARTITQTAISRIRIPRIPRMPTITLPDGTKRPMTKKELAGAVAWKQGFIYIMIYPPYGKDNIEHSRKPFPGVKTTTGARSAYETIARITKGKLPATIKRDMGIMDITISSPKVGKPVIEFKADPKQKTRLTPRRRKPKARPRQRPSPTAMITTIRK